MYAVLLFCLLAQDAPVAEQTPEEETEEAIEIPVPEPREIPRFDDEPPKEVAIVPAQPIAATIMLRKEPAKEQPESKPKKPNGRSVDISIILILLLLLAAARLHARRTDH